MLTNWLKFRICTARDPINSKQRVKFQASQMNQNILIPSSLKSFFIKGLSEIVDAILKNKFGPIREIHTSSNSGMLDSLRLFEEPFFESDIICSHEMVWYDAPN